jgi:hypothetical protein
MGRLPTSLLADSFRLTIAYMGFSRERKLGAKDRRTRLSCRNQLRSPLRFFRLRVFVHLMGLACVACWASPSFGQQPNTGGLATTSFSTYLGYASQALGVGTAITALIGIFNAISDWTTSGRKRRALERAARLAGFIEAVSKMEVGGKVEPAAGLLESAKREFALAAAECYRARALPSSIRRAFLIYLPPRLIAYIPHFLFFTLCALAVTAAIGIGTDIHDNAADPSDLFVVLLIAMLAYFMQQWAALEWRRSQGVLLRPRQMFVGLRWYPANNSWGLFAHSFTVTYPVLLLYGFTAGDSMNQSIYSVWPAWQRIGFTLIGCQLIGVACLWCRAEYLLHSGEMRRVSLRSLVLRVARYPTPENLVGLIVFSLLTIWCLILLLDLRFVQQIASFGDGSAGTAGAGGAYSAVLTVLIVYGVIPWIAVYRGMSDLLNHGRTTAQEVKCG